MYLLGPSHLSFAEVVLFSAAMVSGLFAVVRFFPQRTLIAFRLAVVVLLAFGICSAVYGGFSPGLSYEPLTGYPVYGVLSSAFVVTIESLCLYFMICHRSRGPSTKRFLAATIVFATLTVWTNPPTDLPGYVYANSNFVMVTTIILLLGLAVTVIAYATSYRCTQGTA